MLEFLKLLSNNLPLKLQSLNLFNQDLVELLEGSLLVSYYCFSSSLSFFFSIIRIKDYLDLYLQPSVYA